MIKNYFITALRNFKKNKLYALLNVFGLGIGIASCLFVYALVDFEYSFDSFQTKKNEIFRVTRHYFGNNRVSYNGSIPYPTGDEILNKVPDVKSVVQFHGPVREQMLLIDEVGNQQVFRQSGVLYTTPSFFDMLDFEILRGAPASILEDPFKIFLTEAMATKYFGTKDPIGKIITINSTEEHEVVGIVANPPKNTNLPFECILSIVTIKERHPSLFGNNWGTDWAYSSYVEVEKGQDIGDLERKLDQMMAPHLDDEDKEKLEMHLQPLLEIHNDEKYGDDQNYVTPSLMIYAFILLGALLLATSCLNFINLTTAQATQRAKEVGVRKTLGGSKTELIFQFLSETFVIVFAATIVGLTLGQIIIQWFNGFLTEISYDLNYTPKVIFFSILIMLLITFLAGYYPSMVLSKYKPAEALSRKIQMAKGSGNFNFRRILVITQFTVTNLMIIAALIIAAQMDFVKNKDLGFDHKNLVTIGFPDGAYEKLKTISGEFKSKSYIADATIQYSNPFAGSNWNNSYRLPGGEYIDGNNANMKFADENYIPFHGLELIAGRNISGRIINDSTHEAVVNEKLIATLGWTPEEALGKKVLANSDEFKVVGVMKDFNLYSLHYAIKPVMIYKWTTQLNQLAIRLKKYPTTEELQDIEATFKSFFPNDVLEISIFAEEIEEFYLVENLLHEVILYVSALTIILSVMGLFGLVSFMAVKNSKNIGIRKVFGAPISSILKIFAKEYIVLLSVAFIVAAPIAYFLVDIWLNEFTYHIEPGPKYFIIGFLVSIVIAMLTVGYRSYMAATANPIKSLRYE